MVKDYLQNRHRKELIKRNLWNLKVHDKSISMDEVASAPLRR